MHGALERARKESLSLQDFHEMYFQRENLPSLGNEILVPKSDPSPLVPQHYVSFPASDMIRDRSKNDGMVYNTSLDVDKIVAFKRVVGLRVDPAKIVKLYHLPGHIQMPRRSTVQVLVDGQPTHLHRLQNFNIGRIDFGLFEANMFLVVKQYKKNSNEQVSTVFRTVMSAVFADSPAICAYIFNSSSRLGLPEFGMNFARGARTNGYTSLPVNVFHRAWEIIIALLAGRPQSDFEMEVEFNPRQKAAANLIINGMIVLSAVGTKTLFRNTLQEMDELLTQIDGMFPRSLSVQTDLAVNLTCHYYRDQTDDDRRQPCAIFRHESVLKNLRIPAAQKSCHAVLGSYDIPSKFFFRFVSFFSF